MSDGNMEQPTMPGAIISGSDAAAASTLDKSSPMVDVQVSTTVAGNLSEDISVAESDEDAEGEPDEDFDVDMQIPNDDEEESNEESDSHSSRPGKRKQAVDEEDFIMKDPELYGLRRSVWRPF